MNKLNNLWQYAVFRWFVYQIPLLVFWTLAGFGVFGEGSDKAFEFGNDNPVSRDMGLFIWFLILIIPPLWVWRRAFRKLIKAVWKAVWKLVKAPVRFLNRIAEED